ncbi:MgtC/SapB family protein [Clostridium rectalis]|uniref:MgtC/SapB family protein n=1 Tax=Clostridium rectalis TaxID=2040295 RepID=UPI002432D217|nr:MgtC/SapB family protein [Clostridium rectalis]
MVTGLTTAASLWGIACIGLAVGMGYYTLSILVSVQVFIILVILKKIEWKFIDRGKLMQLEIECLKRDNILDKISEYLTERNTRVKIIEFTHILEEVEIKRHEKSLYSIIVPRDFSILDVLKGMNSFVNIIRVKII